MGAGEGRGAASPRRRSESARLICLLLTSAFLGALACGPSGVAALPAPAPATNAPPAQGGTWITLAPLEEPRQELGVTAREATVYALAGFLPDGSPSATAEAYDVAGDRWRRIASVPQALHHPAAATLDGTVYLIGGYDDRGAVDSLWAYDAAADRWQRRAAMPTARGALTAVVLDGRLYAIGGDRGRSVRDVAAYDPAADAWETLPPMQHARDHLAAAVVNGRIYVAGGRDGRDFTMNVLEEYDPASRAWTDRAAMPTGRSGVAAAAVGGRVYVFGGEGNRDSPQGIFDAVEAYDPAQDAWTRLPPMPTPRHGINAAVVGNRIYLPGGATVEGFGTTGVNEAYEPS
ncbi:MAG TPA: kelch repeat-containing protein [Chloroflexota bacterium]|nr:kelch repeat-containing protein [Chloroflexota bacterium]